MSRPRRAGRASPAASEPESRPSRERRDWAPLQSPDTSSHSFTPYPPSEEARQRLASFPRFRTPARCKMGYHYYDEWRDDQIVGCPVPALRLYGRWLEEHGFEVGDDLQVSVGQGVLLITRRRKTA